MYVYNSFFQFELNLFLGIVSTKFNTKINYKKETEIVELFIYYK